MKTRRMGLSAGLLLAFACDRPLLELGHGPDDGSAGDDTSSAGRDSSPIAGRAGSSGAPTEAGTHAGGGGGSGEGSGGTGTGAAPSGGTGGTGTPPSGGGTGGFAQAGEAVGGGTAGSGNTAGAGATAGAPACVSATTAQLGGCLLDGDGDIVRTPVTAPVTITAITEVMTSLCQGLQVFVGAEISAKELRLRAGDGREWRAIVGVPSLPPAFFDVGDAFDLSVQTEVDPTFYETLDQTFVFSREDSLLFVLASKQRFTFPFVPSLTSFGAAVTDAGMQCVTAGFGFPGCDRAFQRSVQIAIGDASGTLGNGDTRQIGDMSFVLSAYRIYGGQSCDTKGRFQLAGFRVP